MRKLKKVTILFLSAYLTGCVSTQEINFGLSADLNAYKCLKTTSKTILTLTWNTCPILSSKPVINGYGYGWRIIPNPNPSYVESIQKRIHLLHKNVKWCRTPSLITEFLELPIGTEVNILYMAKHQNPSFSGIIFKGSLTFNKTLYKVNYREFLSISNTPIGYDISKEFDVCSNNQ